jgi:hypothetical protein
MDEGQRVRILPCLTPAGSWAPSLFQCHRAPHCVLVPGEDGQVLHVPMAQGLDDGLRALEVGDERDAGLDVYPTLARAVRDAGWEFVGHGIPSTWPRS